MFKIFSNRLVVIAIHVGIGVLFTLPNMSKFFIHFIFVLGLLHIIKNKNSNNEALLWSSYIVGGEVLFRMSGGLFFHESVKYLVMMYLFIGMALENSRKPIPIILFFYFLLISIGIIFTDLPSGESTREAISFNLSGPILLGVVAIYAYRRKIDYNVLSKLFYFGTLPIIAMLSYMYLKTPNLKEIIFSTSANFATSGGFGPNQVSTILGFGVFTISALLLLKRSISSIIAIDVLLLVYLTYRNLLTFSRGGLITSLVAVLTLLFFFGFFKNKKLFTSIKYGIVFLIFTMSIWLYTSKITGGMINYRYEGKNASGVKKEDITSGRSDILELELDIFYQNPFFGVGVGGSKYERLNNGGIYAASHNEIGRLLSEHGLLGLLALIILIGLPISSYKGVDTINRGFIIAFILIWFLTINHSAMRIALPGFVYGLSLITIIDTKRNENSLHR